MQCIFVLNVTHVTVESAALWTTPKVCNTLEDRGGKGLTKVTMAKKGDGPPGHV